MAPTSFCCSISSGIYVVTAEAETGCPRPLGRFPRWRPRDASGGSGAPGPGKTLLQPCHPLRTRRRRQSPGEHRIRPWRRSAHPLAAGDATKTLGQRIRPRRRVGGWGGPFPRRVRPGGLQHPGFGTVLAATGCRSLGWARQWHREYRIRSLAGASWAGMCISGEPRAGDRRCYWAGYGEVSYCRPPGGFTVLDPGKLRLPPGRLPRWPNPWTGPFSGAGTLRARGRGRWKEESR